jgi:hypothetical protein
MMKRKVEMQADNMLVVVVVDIVGDLKKLFAENN